MVAQIAKPDLSSKQLDCSKYTCGVNNKLRKAVWSWSGGLAGRNAGYPSRGRRFLYSNPGDLIASSGLSGLI